MTTETLVNWFLALCIALCIALAAGMFVGGMLAL
jgi:hypothetical protein